MGPSVANAWLGPRVMTNDEGSRQEKISGLNHTAFDLAVYASQWKSPAPTQDSLPAAGPALPDGIGYPQGSDKRFHIASDPPFPSFVAQGHSYWCK